MAKDPAVDFSRLYRPRALFTHNNEDWRSSPKAPMYVCVYGFVGLTFRKKFTLLKISQVDELRVTRSHLFLIYPHLAMQARMERPLCLHCTR